jgi:ribosomal protein L11 methyltransferase
VRRYSLRVEPDDADATLLQMLEWFPQGVEQEDRPDGVWLSGYADRAPAEGMTVEEVADGWETRWREHHRPVRVGRLWIGPPWFEPEQIAVVIDPGSAFGTGAHPSTRAALELLQRFEPQPMLDLGCGSGVLSIAALKLGFRSAGAFDLDPLAVIATGENAARNGVRLSVATADVLTDPLPEAGLWVANLQLDLIERLLQRSDLPRAVIVSGLLASQSVGGDQRLAVEGWAAEVVRTA